jgi:peptide deformylase
VPGSLDVVGTFAVRTFGDPVLRQRAAEVEELDGDLARLAATMVETMYDAIGLGLAAPQVGVLKRLYTYDVGDGPAVLVNPEIVDASGEWSYDEGCLSIPDVHIEIVRPKIVTVRGIDLDGKEVVFEGDEIMGRLIQHEIDHLDGVLMLDRLEPDRRKSVLREMRRTQFDDAGAARVSATPASADRARRL